ncbi:MAG: TlpA family protein disulfide reductase [Gammaproteobacteria bacterium]|nr:TlpA family protein disulfide reductase [Gammaproteobacteria bacterium]
MRPLLPKKAILMIWAFALCPIAWSETPPGEDLDLADYTGKVVVVDFWASWCVPCRRSFPWLNSMNDRYAKDGLVIIGINVDRERESAAEFLQDFPADFEIRYDKNGVLAKRFDVQGMPSSFVIGRDGQTRARHLGFKVRRQDEYEAAIMAALQQEVAE